MIISHALMATLNISLSYPSKNFGQGRHPQSHVGSPASAWLLISYHTGNQVQVLLNLPTLFVHLPTLLLDLPTLLLDLPTPLLDLPTAAKLVTPFSSSAQALTTFQSESSRVQFVFAFKNGATADKVKIMQLITCFQNTVKI